MSIFSPRSVVSWISDLGSRYQKQRSHEQELNAAIELVVDVADSDIRRVGKYQRGLRDAVTAAMGYCSTLVDDLPGPILLSRSSYHADPLVKAVFISDDQMMEILRLALNKGASSGEVQGDEWFALLSMLRTERTIYGREQQGDMMVADVARQTVNFTDHRIVALSPELAATKEKLRNRALEVLATLAMEKIMTIRGKIAVLRERKVHLQSMRRILKGRHHTMDLFAHHSHESSKKIKKIKQQLVELETELQAALGQHATPADSLKILAEILEGAGESLTLQPQSFRVDWMNVLLDRRDSAEGNDISLAKLSAGEELQRWAMIVSFRPGDVETG